MRFVVYGAGAVGGVVAARLAQHGHDVAVIARGDHLVAIRDRGLTVLDPNGAAVVDLPAAGSPAELGIDPSDVVLLAMKSQDTAAALAELAATAPPATPVACLQNDVDNERQALRHFPAVYAVVVALPALHLDPGVVRAYSSPHSGLLDVGRYPAGTDATSQALAAAFSASGLPSIARPDIMRWKYRKLVNNLNNAIEALCGRIERGSELSRAVMGEAEAVLAAAGIEVVSRDEERARRGDLVSTRPVDGSARPGGSTWQSLQRAVGSVEVDQLNGEIVLLGRLHGVPTPVNATLQRLVNDLAATRQPPGAYREEMVLELIATEVDR